MENILAPENALFLVALGLFLLIFLVQLLGLVAGAEPFSFLDGVLPDADLDVADLSPGFVDSIMSMLKMGRVPLVFTLILFLFFFSQIGYFGQAVLHETGIGRLHWLPASGASFVLSLPFLRIGNSILARILPKDESSAISADTFVGRVAIILVGTASQERAAEAKVVGPEGKTHYIRVLADSDQRSFVKGDHVLIVGRPSKGVFTVIENWNPLLED